MGNLAGKLLSNHARSANSDMPPWLLVILEYSDWDIRLKLVLLSKQWRNNTQTAAFHRFLCVRLAEEQAIYVPQSPPSRLDWRTLFSQLYPLRDIWNASDERSRESAANVHKETWKIQVFARFRPLDQRGEEDEQTCASVTLPLHQRLAIIRRRHRLQRNQSALKLLAQEGGWFQAKWKEIADDSPDGTENKENLTNSSSTAGASSFYTQMQTQLPKKMRDGLARGADANKIVSKVMSCDSLSGSVVMMTPDSGLREFLFDGVLPASTSQRSAYDMTVKPLVMDFLNGFNATAVVYGQTGAGKTYSMFGDAGESSAADVRGFLPRACEEVFQALSQRQERHNIVSSLRVSYVEVYGDQVSDLLRYGARCGHSKVAAQRYVLNGAAEVPVSSLEDLRSVLQQGEAQKRRAATAMNDRSTRAHSVFILSLAQQRPAASAGATPRALTSRLFLADLGGSEQVKKSQVAGQQLQEAVYINLGLLALKKVVEALQAGAARHVPYQDAKLTMLLSEGLGGNSKTSIVVCGALHPTHAAETLATLRFGETCRKVETRARKNASCVAGVLDALDAEIAELEAVILRKERWEVQERRREDRLAEEGTWEHAVGGLEVMKVSVVVGAEVERRQLERLLQQRAGLLGSGPLAVEEVDGWEEKEGEEVEEEKKTDEPRKKVVVGFGKQYAEAYGFGAGFDENAEAQQEISRFAAATDQRDLPAVLRRGRRLAASWAQGHVQTEEDVRKTAAAANKKRSQLAYSGISA